MASRSDSLQSHQFMLQRVIGALAMRDPDPIASPVRRIGGALFASVMVAVLAVAAVGVYGVLRPSAGNSWRTGDALIIEEETGARLVYRAGVLHPVLNYSSALLVLGSSPTRARVPRSDLLDVPRGGALGIAGAPDLLPAGDDMLTTPWTLCSRPGGSAANAESVLFVGTTPTSAATTLGQHGLIVRDSTGGLHLLWNNHRYAITDAALVLGALAWPSSSVVNVDAALLNALPAGADLGRIAVEHSDKDSPVAGFKIGQVFVVTNSSGDRRYGVAQSGGLADITSVQADLLLTDGANGLGGKAREMGQAQYAAARKAASLIPTGDGAPPVTAPQPAAMSSSAAPCATFHPGGTAEVTVLSPVPPTTAARPAPRATGDPAEVADWIAVPAGRGVLVQALAGAGSPSGPLALVTDLGIRYPLPSSAVLATLGYGAVTPQRLPAALVALLPSGPALDPAAAAVVVN